MATIRASYRDLERIDSNIETLIKKLRREVEKEGILGEQKKRRHFTKPSKIKYELKRKIQYKLEKKNRRESQGKHTD